MAATFNRQSAAATAGLLVGALGPAILIGSVEPPQFSAFGLVWALFLYALSLIIVAILGMTSLYIIASYNAMRWWLLLIIGFGAGAIIPALIAREFQMFATALYGFGGLIAALFFWLFWTRGPEPTPDQAKKWVRSWTRFQ